MKNDKLYNAFSTDEQRKDFIKYLESHIEELKKDAMISRGITWIVMSVLILGICSRSNVVFRKD